MLLCIQTTFYFKLKVSKRLIHYVGSWEAFNVKHVQEVLVFVDRNTGTKLDPPAPPPQRHQDTEAAATSGSLNSGTQTWTQLQSERTNTGRCVFSAVYCELKL